MKLIKTIGLTLSILTFSTSTIYAAELDCDNPKNFHAKLKCKLAGKSIGSETTKAKEKGKGFFSNLKDKLKYKSVTK